LPRLETGYRSQGILGQRYKGFHIGVIVPLWENKHKVNAAKQNFEYAVLNAESNKLKYRAEIREYYDLLEIRRKMLLEYRELLATLNNSTLLNKALDLGQITVVQYFYDESFYFTAYDKYLQTEWEYQQALARLYKFQL
jgi:outer membrane protein TolC